MTLIKNEGFEERPPATLEELENALGKLPLISKKYKKEFLELSNHLAGQVKRLYDKTFDKLLPGGFTQLKRGQEAEKNNSKAAKLAYDLDDFLGRARSVKDGADNPTS